MHLLIQITTFKKDVLRGDGCLKCNKSQISLALITDVWSKLVRVKEIAFSPNRCIKVTEYLSLCLHRWISLTAKPKWYSFTM